LEHSRISLDGVWQFLHVATDGGGLAEVRSINVPGPWQAQFQDLRARAGIGIYKRVVQLPDSWVKDRIFLRFGAVFHRATVWVNGAHIGDHDGGFLPFKFDITEQIVDPLLEITVKIESPTDDPEEFPDSPFSEIPFGKQSWYGPLSGIWQSVSLDRRIADHLASVRIFSDLNTGKVLLHVRFDQPLLEHCSIETTLMDPDGAPRNALSGIGSCGMQTAVLETQVADPRPWSPDDPKLYGLHARMVREGTVVDECSARFGFRSIESRDGRLYLNGAPFYMRAALDQDYYPEMICTPPSTAFLEDQFRKAKELGLNTLRCHIKAPDPRYYEVADRIGLLIWAELPNGGFSTIRSRARKERTLHGILDRDGNHPCIVCWTLINENWGVDLVHDPHHRKWLKELYQWVKAYDPTRLVVDNSPLAPSFHVQTDIADYHFYAAIPDSRPDWDQFVRSFASRPDWLFSREGDAEITGREPLICSEFGNWGLPHPNLLLDKGGNEPWWFETGHDWGEGVMYPHGVEIRFVDWSLDRVFGDFRSFIIATQWQQYRALKYEIETLRRRSEIAGYVITEFTDCNWESNGLLDMERNPRVFHKIFHAINSDTIIIPTWTRVSYWASEIARVGISVAHGGPRALPAATLWAALDGVEIYSAKTLGMEAPAVMDVAAIDVPIPEDTHSKMRRLVLELRSVDGAVLAKNYLDLATNALRDPSELNLPVWSPDPVICERLRLLGYNPTQDCDNAVVAVATTSEDWLAPFVRNGGRLVFLPSSECSLYPFFPHWQNVRVMARNGTMWRGDWASSFAWLRRRGAFARIPGGPLIDESFDRVIPQHVITGCNLLDFQARVHAGLVVGWVHRPVALCVERNYGRGCMVVSTFQLFKDPPGEDPAATSLLDALVKTAIAAQARGVSAAHLASIVGQQT